jgi:hypothetical protein
VSGPRRGSHPCRGRLGFTEPSKLDLRTMWGQGVARPNCEDDQRLEDVVVGLSAAMALASICSARAISSDTVISSPAARRRRLP